MTATKEVTRGNFMDQIIFVSITSKQFETKSPGFPNKYLLARLSSKWNPISIPYPVFEGIISLELLVF